MGDRGNASGNWVLMVLAVGVVIALLLLVWTVRRSQSPAPSHAAVEDRRDPQRAAQHPNTKTTRDLPVDEATDDGVVRSETADKVTVPLAELLARSSTKVIEAAVPCYGGGSAAEDTARKVVFDFIVVFDGGEARIDEVIPVESDLGDKELERCILEKVSTARWKTPNSSALTKRWRQSISRADLSR